MKSLQLCCILFLIAFGFGQDVEDEDSGGSPFDAILKGYEAYKSTKKKGRTGASNLPEDLVQGDMVLDDRDKVSLGMIIPGKGRTTAKSFLGYIRKLWTTRIIPYSIDHPGDRTRKISRGKTIEVIKASLRDIEKKTCLRFRPKRNSDNNWIHYTTGVGCYSGIGRKYYKKAATTVVLGAMCISKSIVIHETLHSLGFFHEQSRRDRDNYVKIYLYNVRSSMRSNFDKWDKLESDTYGTEYDYNSIMHYSQTAFTKNGERTLEAKYDPDRKVGGDKLSPTDIEEIKRMYHCHEPASATWTEWSGWSNCGRTWTKECIRSKHRICLSENIANCVGSDKYNVQEKIEDCASQALCDVNPQDGFWSQWGRWTGPCSRSCGMGTRTRSRSCNNPVPKDGGRNCPGNKLETITCPNKGCSNAWDTNFSNGWGNWKQDKNDDFDWKIGQGPSSNLKTGPKEDHTDGKGRYAYVSSRIAYQKARLVRSMSVNGETCFSFAYIMNGKHVKKLDIYIKRSSGAPQFVNLWARIGHQSQHWQTARLQLPRGRYQIFIEGVTGASANSDIAVDDIYIDRGKCLPEKCINSNKGCDGWMKTGECQKNTKWMMLYCCKSCLNSKVKITKKTKLAICKDKPEYASKCSGWASNGECNKNKVWMSSSCCQTCKTATCKNNPLHDSKCGGWVANGECTKNKSWMSKNCCKACKTVVTCKNNHSKCGVWATNGECTKNKSWMSNNCCKACRTATRG